MITGVLITGVASGLGEVSHYGYIKNLPSIFIGAFSTGSGFSGFTSSLSYLLLNTENVKNEISFLSFIALAVIYFVNFLSLHSLVIKNNYFQNSDEDSQTDNESLTET